MKLKEINSLLKTLELPVAYRVFQKPQKLPYIIYFTDDEEHRGSDAENLINEKTVIIELYTKNKDIELEEKLDALFKNYAFEKYESYIDSEKMFQIAYHIDFIDKI